MRSVSEFEEIYLCKELVDLRKSIGGLSALAQEEMGAGGKRWRKSES